VNAGCGPSRRLLPFYLNGSLAEDEAAVVRSHLETCTACRTDLDTLLPLARAIETHGAGAGPMPLADPLSPFPAAEHQEGRAVLAQRMTWLAAAAVLVLIAAGVWRFSRPGIAPHDRSFGPYVLDLGNGPERGDAQLPVLATRLGDRALTLVFFVPVSPDARYSADLQDSGGRVLAHADAVGPPDALGRISWTVPPLLLQAMGEHEVAIVRTDPTGERRIYRYAFRVDLPPS